MPSRAVLVSLLGAALATVAAASRADADCDDSDGQGYDYWSGHIVDAPLIGYAADRFLVVEHGDVIALDRDGATGHARETDLAANLNVRRLASSPDAHLVLGMSQVDSGDVVADLL